MKHLDIFEQTKPMFLRKLNLIRWEAAQWMQYSGYDYDEKHDTLTLHFKTSSYGIMFDVETKAFSSLYGEPFIPFNEAYEFFRSTKYNEAEDVKLS
jgi:hypothetical protein